MAKSKKGMNRGQIVSNMQQSKGLMNTLKRFGGRVAAGLAQAVASVTQEDKELTPKELRQNFHAANYRNQWPGFTQRIPTPGKRARYSRG